MTSDKVFNKVVISGITLFLGILVLSRYLINHNVKDIIEFSILLLSAILILIFDKKVLIYCLIVFVAAVMQMEHNSLYASLLAFTISAFIKRKYLIPLTIIYHLNTIVVLITSQNELNVNVVFFYTVCTIIFILILTYPNLNLKELNLTNDEKLILNELIKGKQLKEIDAFSKNTKTEKLKAACKRNNLIDKNELIFLYKWGQSH